jgi:UDP-N-acetylmuramate--alanine ligase
MGILGSGCASVAIVAAQAGFRVSGCDQSTESYYAEKLMSLGVTIYAGHSKTHLDDDVDVVAVSPAIFDVSPDNEELLEAKRRGILMTWQQFMGEYLQRGKRVIAVSGTHGKTTTTFMTSEILIEGGLDPSVVGGSVYQAWDSGGRFGESDLFLCEADEFNRNFHHYSPETAVVLTVEMDHPECYRDFEEVLESFTDFLVRPGTVRRLIINGDSPGSLEVLRRAYRYPVLTDAEIYPLFHGTAKDLPIQSDKIHPVVYEAVQKTPEMTTFRIRMDGISQTFRMILPGEYNIQNAAAAITIARVHGVSDEKIQKGLLNFVGAKRRFDCIGTRSGVPVYDDYAHHPSEISSVLTMCREYFPGRKILAIFEPHQISRLTLMFDAYVEALTIAHHVVIWRTHMGREILSDLKPIPGETWEKASPRIHYEEDTDEIIRYTDRLIEEGECDMILVIGAASSYHISRRLTGRKI